MAEAHKHELPKGFELQARYRIERVLGAGGFAITYLAHHTGLNQKAAIKEYLPDEYSVRSEDRATVRSKRGEEDEFNWGLTRFADEARTLAKFRHPNIVPVTDIFEANGTAYMVMEYVDGESLSELLTREGTLPEPALRNLLDPLLDALEAVHAEGILHRDIKPANIFIRKDGSPILLDFGNARQAIGSKTKSLTATLTPGYAPNEQYVTRGKQGPWTDIYSLGATVYRIITGEEPPEAPARAMTDTLVPALRAGQGRYSTPFLATIDKALAFKPEDRPQDIGAFRALLAAPPDQGETVTPAKPAKPTRRHPTGATVTPRKGSMILGDSGPRVRAWPWVLAAVLLLAIAGGGYWGWTRYQDGEQRRLASVAAKRSAEKANEERRRSEARKKAAEDALHRAEAARKQREEKARKRVETKRRADAKRREDARRRAEEEARGRAEAEARALLVRVEAAIEKGDLNAARRLLDEAEKLAPGLKEARAKRDILVKAGAKRRAEEERKKRASTRFAPGRVFKDCSTCPEMVMIPGGTFLMGSPPGEQGRYKDEGPQHRVTVQRFAMGKYEVTFSQWYACPVAGGCSRRPRYKGWGRGNYPVFKVSWKDAKQYVAWLSRKTGKRYRLPSEAEWEYAARAGTRTKYWWGNAIGISKAVCSGCGSQWDDKGTAPVDSFYPNRFGLYNIHGNVWEWVEDCWHKSYAGAPANGRPWITGGNCNERVLRGGSWLGYPRYLRSAFRKGLGTGIRSNSVGFRVARTLP